MSQRQLSDETIRDRLRDLDESDRSVSSWEADFLESILFKRKHAALTTGQRDAAMQIIDKYQLK